MCGSEDPEFDLYCEDTMDVSAPRIFHCNIHRE